MDEYAILWLVLMVIFLIVEVSTVSVVSIWFVAGALCAMGVALLGGALWIQCVVFAAVSAILLLSLRPILRKYFKPRLTPTNADALIGTQGLVTQQVDNLKGTGRIKLGAVDWAARSTGGEVIPEGTLVKVDKIEGVKVFLTPVKQTEEETVCL